jgi:hypothetical protein
MATEDRRELIVCCGLGHTTLPLAQLSRTLVAVQSNPRNDFNRRRDEVIAAPGQDQEIYV